MLRRLLITASVLVLISSMSLAQDLNEDWATNFGPAGVSGTVKALKKWGDTLVVAGDIAGLRLTSALSPGFLMFDLVERSWKFQSDDQMDFGDEVRAVEVLPNGDLVVGGDFSFTSDGMTLENLAVYRTDGTWSTLSGDSSDLCNGPVNALLVFEGRLYIGGEFSNIGATDPDFSYLLAIWDETAGFIGYDNQPLGFSSIDGNSQPVVYALAGGAGPSGISIDRNVYIGGDFVMAPGDTLGGLARLETTSRNVYGVTVNGANGPVYAVAIPNSPSYDEKLFIGGEFTMIGDTSAANCMLYEVVDKTWHPLDDGLNGPVYTIKQFPASSSPMHFGGDFDSSGATLVGAFPSWPVSGSGWNPTEVTTDGPVNALESIQGNFLAVGGDFEFAGDSSLFYGVFYTEDWDRASDSVMWSLGDAIESYDFAFERANDVAADDNGDFYVTGGFDYAGGALVNYIARWDGEKWYPLGEGLASAGFTLAVNGDTVYVAGGFATAGGVAVNEIAMWDGSSWSDMAGGLPGGDIDKMAIDTLGHLYVGGRDLDANGAYAANALIKWDGTQWLPVGDTMVVSSGVPKVYDIYIDSLTNDVWVCGRLHLIGGNFVNNLARWNGSFWQGYGDSDIGDGLPELLERSPEGDIIVVGVIDRPEFRRLDGDSLWLGYAGGIATPDVKDLLTIGCDVYLTGDPLQFVNTEADPIRVPGIGRWNGLAWDSLGNGNNFGNMSLAAFGDQLAVGGDFTRAGGQFVRGFSIWSGVNAGASAASVTLTSPGPNDTLTYGNVTDITWDTSSTAEEVVVEVSYDSGGTWQIIHNHGITKRGKLSWLIPDTNAAFCMIRLSDGAAPCVNTVPGYTFAITADSALESHWLQRAGGTYYDEPFTIGYHNWNFSNGKGNIWPDTFSQNIDYSGFPEPPDTVENFPDWYAFCEAFGPDYCYRGGDPDRIRSKALKFWKSLLTEWGGSCYGFTQTALLRFKYKSWNLGFFLPWDDLFFEDLNTFYRNVINKYWIYQKGEKFNDFEEEGFALGPIASMQKVRDGFFADYPRGLSFFYRQWDTVMVNDTVAQPVDSVWTQKGHSVVPYRIFEWPDTTGIYYMYVYDNNAPNDTNRIVRIDSINNWWRFQEYYPRDTAPGLMPDPNVLEYETYATDDPVGPFRMPLAEDKTTVLTSATENIVMTNGSGQRIGWLGNDLLLEDSASIPLLPRDPGYPYLYPQGYYIPDGDYTIELSNFTDSTTSIFIDDDTISYGYSRSGALYNHVDKLVVGDGIAAVSGFGGIKTFTLSTITTTPTVERYIEFTELTLAGIDSVHMSVDTAGAITLWNTGINKAYKLLLWNSDAAMAEDEITQSMGFTTIFAGETHKIVPAWGMLESLPTLLLKDTEQDGIFEDTSVLAIVTDVEDDLPELPDTYTLSQNYPNPFNPATSIDFSLPVAGEVSLEVINVLGQRVRMLVDKELAAGSYFGRMERHQRVGTGRGDRYLLLSPDCRRFLEIEKDAVTKVVLPWA